MTIKRPLPCPSPLPFANAALQPIPTGDACGGGGGGGGSCGETGGTTGGTSGDPCIDAVIYSLPSPTNPNTVGRYFPVCTDPPCLTPVCPTEPQ